MAIILVCLLFISQLDICFGHLCLFYPQQRGTFHYNIYYPFPIPECARHGEPCGGMPPEKPFRVFEAGTQAYVKWQQNVNMYEVGYPGYMEISIAPLNSTNFEVLAVVEDQYKYGKYVRQNYSALIVVPNMDCEHCVLRARYNSHKPGEPVFVQCADVTVTSSSNLAPNIPRHNFPPNRLDYHELTKGLELQYSFPVKRQNVEGLTLYGFAYNPYEANRLEYVKIDLQSGKKEGITKYQFGIGLGWSAKTAAFRNEKRTKKFQENFMFVADSVLTVNKEKGQTSLLYHESGNLDTPPIGILEINTQTGAIIRSRSITNVPPGLSFSSLISIADGYITFSIQQTQRTGEYVFVVGKVNSEAVYQSYITTPTTEKVYLNFEWAEYNEDEQMLYVLLNKANASQYTYEEVPRLYNFDIAKGTFVSYNNVTAQYVPLFGRALHYYKKTGKLYALSPGYWGSYKYADWGLSEVNPTNANITMTTGVTSDETFDSYSGGIVFSGIDQSRGVLYQVLHIADAEADVIVAVDIETRKATFSKMTNLRHIHNLYLVSSV